MAITPQQAKQTQTANIPQAVVKVFDELLVKHFDGRSARILQDEVLDKLLAEHNIDRHDAFGNNWLDIEPIYEQTGWKVQYVKGPYYDDSPRYFMFTATATKQ